MASALLPILFFLYPGLLIVGGIIQPRFPTAGKWFVWVGAASLWVDVIVYDEMNHHVKMYVYVLDVIVVWLIMVHRWHRHHWLIDLIQVGHVVIDLVNHHLAMMV